MAISTWPGEMRVSGGGFVMKPVSPRRARTIAPVSWRTWASRKVDPAIDKRFADLDLGQPELEAGLSCITTSMNSATFGCRTKAAYPGSRRCVGG